MSIPFSLLIPGILRVLLLTFGMAVGASGAPRLSEFLAENEDVIRDADGDTSDYLEIYNPEPEPVSLQDYRLTNRPDHAAPWPLPAISLQPGEHRIIWASGKNRRNPKTELHTDFTLEKSGGYLALLPPEGTLPLTEFAAYPAQFADRTYGLYQPEEVRFSLPAAAPCRWFVPQSPVPGWQARDYTETGWTAATTGIGFDVDGADGTFPDLFGESGDMEESMFEHNATALVRIPFQLAGRQQLSGLTLRLKCDDGFIAWINGARVASRFAPESPSWNSAATALQDDEDALVEEVISIPDGLGSLVEGTNVLAIQLLNGSASNIDALLVPRLELRALDATQPLRTGYFATPTPGAANAVVDGGFTADTTFEQDRGFYHAPFSLRISCATPGATIYYTTDSSTPTPRTGRIYTGPIAISQTTVVRAMADGDGLHPSNVDTQTYLFPEGILRQTAPPEYPATWGISSGGFGGALVPADYAMDPEVVDDPAYHSRLIPALEQTLPVVSLNAERGLWFDPEGIYANGRFGSEEIPVSLEWFGPGLTSGTAQIDGGVRIHGGNAREHPKKPMRLYFRKRYGTDKWRYPLFPGSPVQSFDQLILRPGGHDGWAVPFGNEDTLLAAHGTYLKDQFLRLTETQMGRLSPRGRYVHVYLNGLYWGVYDLHERANADYYSSHLGGTEEEWDVVHHPTFEGETYSQVDGTGEAWDTVQQLADQGIETPEQYEAFANLVDVEDYIDHLIVRMWSGDYDWCGPVFLKNGNREAEAGYFDNKNWYAARRSRGAEPGKFLFHVWDAEMSMGSHLMLNRGFNLQPPWLPYYPPQRITGFDSTRVGTPGSLAWPYAALRAYPPFRQKFGDRVQKHLLGQGLLTLAENQKRLDGLTAQLALPLVAESARWGDVNRLFPLNVALTPNSHWKPEIEWLRNTFLPERNPLVLQQFAAIGLYQRLPAPVAVPGPGLITPGTPLDLTVPGAPDATVYYTLDGSEPSAFTGQSGLVLVEEGAPCTWWVPLSNINNSWRTISGPSNPDAWNSGLNGLGYDTEGDYLPHYRTDVGLAMRNVRSSVYVRIEFAGMDQAVIDSISTATLEMKYDDGFIAALNGTVVQRASAPPVESSQSFASAAREETAAVRFTRFQLPADTIRSLLQPGKNVLAIQGLNQSVGSSDFLCTARLLVRSGGLPIAAPAALRYDPAKPPLLPANALLKARAAMGAEWSPLTEVQWYGAEPASPGNLVPYRLHYHPSPPSETEVNAGYADADEFEYLALLNRSIYPLDLTGCVFTHGITFSFDDAAVKEVPAGGIVVVARNPAALQLRYGEGLLIAGAFAGNTGLSNSGERLRLQARDGTTVFDLTWNDSFPWPAVADGGGPSLLLINPRGLSGSEIAQGWQTLVLDTGSPTLAPLLRFSAWSGTQSGPAEDLEGDPDSDGSNNLLEFACGTDPWNPASVPFLRVERQADQLFLSFGWNTAAEASLELEEAPAADGPWTGASGLQPVPEEFSTSGPVWQTPLPSQPPQKFYRLRATLPGS